MRHTSFLCRLAAAVLSCTLCCAGMPMPAASAEETGDLPAKFDLRDIGAVTSVKLQAGGTCGAFSSIAAIESNLIMQGMADNTIDLSEEHLSWFANVQGTAEDPDDPLRKDRKNQDMDHFTDAVGYRDVIGLLSSRIGVVPASMTPRYKDKEPLDESLRYESIAHLRNAVRYDELDFSSIKKNLMEKGAMMLCYYNLHTLESLYSERGSYYQNKVNYRDPIEGQENVSGGGHAVCLVGWDDNFPKEDFVITPPGDGAWICKNSWGEKDSKTDNGYIYISYYDGSVHDIVQYEMVAPEDDYDSCYQYSCSLNARISLTKHGGMFGNVYTAQKDENLTAVSTFFEAADFPYDISLYALKDDYENPCDGELLAQLKGALPTAGYYTIPLDEVIQVKKGTNFSIVFKIPIQEYCIFNTGPGKKGERKVFYAIYSEGEPVVWKDPCAQGVISAVGSAFLKVFTTDGTVINEENFPDPESRSAAEALDKNGDGILSEKEQAADEPFIRGDLNRDGKVNAVDLSLLKQVLLGSQQTGLCLPAGDWNGDGDIGTEDAAGILDFLLQKDAA